MKRKNTEDSRRKLVFDTIQAGCALIYGVLVVVFFDPLYERFGSRGVIYGLLLGGLLEGVIAEAAKRLYDRRK